MRRRNISIFFDGTGQCRDVQSCYNWSNVALLYDAVSSKPNDEVVQSRKYLDGVGTREGETLSGGGFGIGLDERVEEAYDFLYQEFDKASKRGEEPHVYIFGFSRGAFAARWFASLLDFSGVSKGSPTPRKLFVNHQKQNEKEAKHLIESQKVYYPVSVDFLGVWDTVEASIDKIDGIDILPKCVAKAFHALAIDEWREPFKPTRFKKSEKVTEVWFPGSHTDIGGGYEIRTLANAPLRWMVAGSVEQGLIVDYGGLNNRLEQIGKCAAFHDELSNSLLWKSLNKLGGKYFREIEPLDYIDTTVNKYADNSPSDRQTIPQSCVVMNDRDTNDIIARMC